METLFFHGGAEKYAWFKSYYVVWKHSSRNWHGTFQVWFKSYYVVWKLKLNRPILATAILFKSYYVVWKLFRFILYIVFAMCLNRTM